MRERILEDLEDSKPVQPSAIDRYRSSRSIPIIDAILRFLFF